MKRGIKKATRKDIVQSVYDKTDFYNEGEIYSLLNAILEDISERLIDGQTIELRGFGTFLILQRKGREKTRNPKTGLPSKNIEPHSVVSFRAGRELKKSVWNIKEKKNDK